MRKSLSVTSVVAALGLSVLLAVVALADQVGGQSLMDHADAMYASHGKDPSAGLLYGTLYTIAGLGIVLWLLALRSVRAGSRWARLVVAVNIVVLALLAVVVLVSSEYGDQIWPTSWGILALLPALAGVPALPGRRREPVSATSAAPRTTAGSSARTS